MRRTACGDLVVARGAAQPRGRRSPARCCGEQAGSQTASRGRSAQQGPSVAGTLRRHARRTTPAPVGGLMSARRRTSVISDADQCIGRLEPTASKCRRQHRLDGLELFGRIHPQVHLGGADIGVAKPERDLADVAGSLQHQDRTTVPQKMWRQRAAAQRRASGRSGFCVLFEDVFEAGAGHRHPLCVDEQLRRRRLSAHRKPGAQVASGFLPERKAAFAPALAEHQDARPRLQSDILQGEADQLGDAQTAGEAQVQHGPIP